MIDPNITWGSYLGGSTYDYAYGVATDGSGNVYVSGYTDSSGWVSGGWDTTHVGDLQGFIVKLSGSSVTHLWSSYLGKVGDDYADGGVATDGSGNVYVSGDTWASGWVSGGWNTSYGGGR